MKEKMVDPLTVAVLGAAGYVVKKVADAGAEVVLLRGRTALVEAAGRLPAGSEISVVGHDGSRWLVRAGVGELGR
ncbi:hypothetical protein [Catellatospora sp. NPDC049133]|uniref:hypothetical protein n=1 Tax=Catellatospora sp. NPDC049133 TaxID=3155499 RepID=UPI0033F8D712